MAYSEIRIVFGGLAHFPILIFIANFIKVKFGVKSEEVKETLVKDEPVKVIEEKETVVEVERTKAIEELSNKLDYFEEKADKIYERVKKKRKDKQKKKRKA